MSNMDEEGRSFSGSSVIIEDRKGTGLRYAPFKQLVLPFLLGVTSVFGVQVACWLTQDSTGISDQGGKGEIVAGDSIKTRLLFDNFHRAEKKLKCPEFATEIYLDFVSHEGSEENPIGLVPEESLQPAFECVASQDTSIRVTASDVPEYTNGTGRLFERTYLISTGSLGRHEAENGAISYEDIYRQDSPEKTFTAVCPSEEKTRSEDEESMCKVKVKDDVAVAGARKLGSRGQPSDQCGCFSPLSWVHVQDKGLTSMKDLQIGDKVLSERIVGDGGDGQSGHKFQSVYAFDKRDTVTATDFVQLFTSMNERPLELTPSHLVYVEGQSSPIPAANVKIGDHLLGLKPLPPPRVTKVDRVSRKGFYSPLTADGTIVVDGIVASTYVSFDAEALSSHVKVAGIPVVSWHFIEHMWITPVRIFCMVMPNGTCRLSHEASHEHGYGKAGGQIARFFREQSAPFQALILLAICTFLLPLYFGELVFLTPGLTAAKLFAVIFMVWGFSTAKKGKNKKLQAA